jgi:hypothetical protein
LKFFSRTISSPIASTFRLSSIILLSKGSVMAKGDRRPHSLKLLLQKDAIHPTNKLIRFLA